MTTLLIVEKLGNIKECVVKQFDESELFKRAGFKKEEGFKLSHVWNVSLKNKKYNISLYGKTTGKANTENKYDFPPPVDTELFFGNCILVNFNDEEKCVSLSLDEWEKIYEYLFGGFDDTKDDDDEEEDDEEDEEEDDEDLPVTKKGGYLKDGFVVDDDEEEEEDEEEDEEEEDEEEDEEEVVVVVSKKKAVKKAIKAPVVEKELYMDCQSELDEEAYFSDTD
jgi:hypothetical protein